MSHSFLELLPTLVVGALGLAFPIAILVLLWKILKAVKAKQ
jgi:hypothetical protein